MLQWVIPVSYAKPLGLPSRQVVVLVSARLGCKWLGGLHIPVDDNGIFMLLCQCCCVNAIVRTATSPTSTSSTFVERAERTSPEQPCATRQTDDSQTRRTSPYPAKTLRRRTAHQLSIFISFESVAVGDVGMAAAFAANIYISDPGATSSCCSAALSTTLH